MRTRAHVRACVRASSDSHLYLLRDLSGNACAQWCSFCSSQVMFVGLDVHHSGTLGQPGASVAGYVAVLDRYCTRFYSRSFLVKSRQQILVPPTDQDPNLQSLTVQALGRFAAGNKKLPKYVVVYRDGGSEGELEAIHRVEVKAIQVLAPPSPAVLCHVVAPRHALQRPAMSWYRAMHVCGAMPYSSTAHSGALLQDGLEEARAKAAAHTKQPVDVPQLVFFVALKKIRTRFFAAATGSAPWPHTHAVGNPMPGTIIDTDITSNLLQEFYICCQHVNQVWTHAPHSLRPCPAVTHQSYMHCPTLLCTVMCCLALCGTDSRKDIPSMTRACCVLPCRAMQATAMCCDNHEEKLTPYWVKILAQNVKIFDSSPTKSLSHNKIYSCHAGHSSALHTISGYSTQYRGR